MKDLSYHILDIVQNSLHAGASRVEMDIEEDTACGKLKLAITDNGTGMSHELLKQATDPFFTSSAVKKVGLGLPLLRQNAEQTGGNLQLESEEKQGTRVRAVFNSGNIDMLPLGDMASTLRTLIAASPDKDFVYRHRKDGEGFNLDTAVIRNELDGLSLTTREVLDYIADYVNTNLKALYIQNNNIEPKSQFHE